MKHHLTQEQLDAAEGIKFGAAEQAEKETLQLYERKIGGGRPHATTAAAPSPTPG